MADVVNLRTARKRKTRAQREAAAAANRAQFGGNRSEHEARKLSRDLDEKRLGAHRRERQNERDEPG